MKVSYEVKNLEVDTCPYRNQWTQATGVFHKDPKLNLSLGWNL